MKGRPWTEDEFIVTLHLYKRVGPVGNSHPEVKRLAELCSRTPGSIALRLGNWQAVDPERTGPGLEAGRNRCQPIWDLYEAHPGALEKDARSAKSRLLETAKRRIDL